MAAVLHNPVLQDMLPAVHVKANMELPEMLFETGSQNLIVRLMRSDEKGIGEVFSKNLGREVVFVKAPELKKLVEGKPSFKSYWEIAEFLAGKGRVTFYRLHYPGATTLRHR